MKMLYRYAFPVPKHGEMLSITRYIEANHSPTLNELLSLFEHEKQVEEDKAQEYPKNECFWSIVREIDAILYCLNHLSVPDLPRLPSPDNLKTIPIFCKTQLESSTMRISIIEPFKLDVQQVAGQK